MTMLLTQWNTETILVQDPRIRAAVIFGRGRTQNGVIIEPAQEFKFDVDDEIEKEHFIKKIWCVHVDLVFLRLYSPPLQAYSGAGECVRAPALETLQGGAYYVSCLLKDVLTTNLTDDHVYDTEQAI